MTEHSHSTTPENTETAEQLIAARDELFAIEEFPIEDTLQFYPVRRTNGKLESNWLLVGEGIHPNTGEAVGKFTSVETAIVDGQEVRRPVTKYLPMEAQNALRSVERERIHTEAQAMGEKAVEQVVDAPEPERTPPYIEPENERTKLYSRAEIQALKQSGERSGEDEAYSYLREVLPPVIRPQSETQAQSYDRLFNKDEGVEQGTADNQRFYQPKSPEDKQREYYDRFVTEENRREAANFLTMSLRANPQIEQVLREAGLDPTSIEAVDAIREDPDIRYEVAKSLVKKLDQLVTDDPEGFGWRIERNSPNNLKVDPQTGKRMSSRLYAVNMALKMIDGEFSDRHDDNDQDYDEQGRIAVGQHRHAARNLLLSN